MADFRDSLRYSLYIATGVAILTLTGIFDSFASYPIFGESFTLGTVLLMFVMGGTGFYLTSRLRAKGRIAAFQHGFLGAMVVAVVLALMVFTENRVDMNFVFRNLKPLLGGSLTFGQQDLFPGLLLLLLSSGVFSLLGGLIVFIPRRLRDIGLSTAGLIVIIAILERQIDDVITLGDAAALTFVFGIAYLASLRIKHNRTVRILGTGLIIGISLGIILALLTNAVGLERNSILRGEGSKPLILEVALNQPLAFIIIMAIVGMVGALTVRAANVFHDGIFYLLATLLIFGMLNLQEGITFLLVLTALILLSAAFWFVPSLGKQAEQRFSFLPRGAQHNSRRLIFLAVLGILLVTPTFAGLSITNTFNYVLLYITMGVGLNVMVGYAGLLDLGYVASYAIGAYTAGVLATPSMVTCGGLRPDAVSQLLEQGQTLQQACSGILTFWEALPIAILFSASVGILLGIPVLRLRGDYLAIVTLGFGQIINRLISSDKYKDLLGGPQGISQIPNAVIDFTRLNPNWHTELNGATGYYYLLLFSVMVALFVVSRLVDTRLGRAWRAMRADEDVAEAMGINLVQTKLLAFGLSSAFAGLGGAIFGAWLRSIFPNSFELAVSINVLALIIIGGMGSIPGIIVGSLVLIGVPDLLRELQDYRLLAFGSLLVVVMILRPEGLLPPKPLQLAKMAAERQREQEVAV
ncbi:MAG: hypothetical protein H7Y09_15695 [Chitinophagaceae bacterium]|nr:hypothetical protein [Anaerolineae bacterium]